MAAEDTERVPVRWGFGDACIGFAAAYVLVFLLTPLLYWATGQSYDTERRDLPLSTVALTQVPFYGGMLGWALIASFRKGRGPIADYRIQLRLVDVPVGIVVGVLTQLAGNLVLKPVLWFTSYTNEDIERPARELADKAHGAGVVLLVLIVAIAAPIVEEIFFRGLVLRSLERRMSTGWAVVATGAIFAATHFEPLQFPALFLFGLVAGVLVARTGRLGPAVWAHLAFNGLAVFSLLH